MVGHEDFGDEPSLEERMPFGMTPDEMQAVWDEAFGDDDRCVRCREQFGAGELIEAGMYEFYTMDLDPGTLICAECLDAHREQYIPDDPMLFDCLTPIVIS